MKRSRASGHAFRILGAVLLAIGSFGTLSSILTIFTQPTQPVVTDSDNPDAVRAKALIEEGEAMGRLVLGVGGVVMMLVGAGMFRYGRRHVIELASESLDT
jgi:hypothetical protein